MLRIPLYDRIMPYLSLLGDQHLGVTAQPALPTAKPRGHLSPRPTVADCRGNRRSPHGLLSGRCGQ